MDKQKFFKEVNKFKTHKVDLSIVSDTEAIEERFKNNLNKFFDLARQLKEIQNEAPSLGSEIKSDFDALMLNIGTLQQKADEIGITIDELVLDYITSKVGDYEYTVGLVEEVSAGVFNITGLSDFR